MIDTFRVLCVIALILFAEIKDTADYMIVKPDNIYVGMLVYKNPNWQSSWGHKVIHPQQDAIGKIRSWSDAQGRLHGYYQKDKNQLRWPSLACVNWINKKNPWKSIQAYRIGFANEYWLASPKPIKAKINHGQKQ